MNPKLPGCFDMGALPRRLSSLNSVSVFAMGHTPVEGFRRSGTDPFLKSTFMNYVRGKRSITSLIWHSPDNRRLFGSYVKRLKLTPYHAKRIRDLQSAPHRHSSTQKPTGRFVALFDALLSLSQHLAKTKQGKPKDVARDFLLSFQPEHLLTLGMLADAGDEEIILLRKFDAAIINPTQVTEWLSDYLRRLECLFDEKQAVKSGYTAWAPVSALRCCGCGAVLCL